RAGLFGQAIGLVALHHCGRDLHHEAFPEDTGHVSEGIDRVCRRLMLGCVIDEKLIRRLVNRFPPLLARFLFDNLAVVLFQPLALSPLLGDGLGFVGGTRRTTAPPAIQHELEMIQLTVFEYAHRWTCRRTYRPN